MCKVLSKSSVDELLMKNNIPYSAVTAYINGSDKLTKWTFENEMKRKENFFPKNLERKLKDFFFIRHINIPNNAYIDEERRGKTGDRTRGTMENNVSPKISDRLTEIGWKKSFLMHWFGNSTGKLYNIIKQHKPLIEVSEYNLVAYFARCKPTALVYGGGQNGLFNDSEFVQSVYVPCPYIAKKDFFEKLDDDEISKFLKNMGFPCYFFNEMLEGRLKVPESAAVKIARYFKQDDVEFIFNYNSLDNKNKDEIKEKEISVSFEEAAKLFDQKKPSVVPSAIGEYHPIEHKSEEDKKWVKSITDILKFHYRDISVDDLEKLGQLCKHYSKVKRDLDDLL